MVAFKIFLFFASLNEESPKSSISGSWKLFLSRIFSSTFLKVLQECHFFIEIIGTMKGYLVVKEK